MLNVTDSAKRHLKELLLDKTDDPDFGVRLTVGAPGQIGLVLDRAGPSDQVVEYEGAKVLLVGQEEAQLLPEATLDTQDTPEGRKLIFSKG